MAGFKSRIKKLESLHDRARILEGRKISDIELATKAASLLSMPEEATNRDEILGIIEKAKQRRNG